jgi:PAS domain S-box-containing protein
MALTGNQQLREQRHILEDKAGKSVRGHAADAARLADELTEARSQLSEARQSSRRLAAEAGELRCDLENVLNTIGHPLLIVDNRLRIKSINQAARDIFYLTPNMPPKDLSQLRSRIPLPDLSKSVRLAIDSQRQVEEEIKAGNEIFAMRVSPFPNDEGQTAGALVMFSEKTSLIQAERERSSIGYIAQLFMLYDDLDDFYRELPRVLAQRLNFPYALLELFDGEHEEAVLMGSYGLEGCVGTADRRSLPGSVTGWVIQSGRTYVQDSSRATPQPTCPPLGDLPVETLLAAPLRIKDAVLGVITLADHRRRGISEHLVETLEVVGINAGLGIERRRAQQTVMEATTEALVESLDRYRKIVDTANEGIWIVNNQLRTEFVNPQMANMLGYPAKEIRGKSAFHFLPIIDRREALRKWRRTRQGLQESSDWRLLRRDGGHLWAQISTSPLYDEEGRFSGALGMVADITHRKRSEEKLLQQRHKLRALASELTLVEERERRRIASDMHDGVGHLLAAIKLRLDMLKGLDPDPGQGSHIDGILEVLDQAIATTRSLISDLSPPVLHEMGLAAALEWLAERVSQMSGVAVSAQVEPPQVAVSEELAIFLFRAASELLTNVVKHSGAKNAGVALHNEAGKLRLLVEDDGVGFETSQIKTDSFGLFSIRERLSFLGGHLEIDSRINQGTRAALTIELERQAD